MGFEAIKELAKQKGKSLEIIAMRTGISYNSLSKIIRGTIKSPKYSTIKSIAESLDMSVDELSYAIDPSGTPPELRKSPLNLTLPEQKHIKKYRDLDSHGKKMVDFVVDEETKRVEELMEESINEEAEQIYTIPLQLSQQSAAAGHGIYLGPEAFEIIYVVENKLTKKAAFAVPVSGDSMQPRFYDGDILLISNEIPEINEIGIFTMDSNGYVKKRGKNELISLNNNYKPIPMDESIIANGKVIGVLDPEWIVDK